MNYEDYMAVENIFACLKWMYDKECLANKRVEFVHVCIGQTKEEYENRADDGNA